MMKQHQREVMRHAIRDRVVKVQDDLELQADAGWVGVGWHLEQARQHRLDGLPSQSQAA